MFRLHFSMLNVYVGVFYWSICVRTAWQRQKLSFPRLIYLTFKIRRKFRFAYTNEVDGDLARNKKEHRTTASNIFCAIFHRRRLLDELFHSH